MTLYGQGNGLHKATLTISNGLSYDGKKSNYPSSGVKSRKRKNTQRSPYRLDHRNARYAKIQMLMCKRIRKLSDHLRELIEREENQYNDEVDRQNGDYPYFSRHGNAPITS